MLFHIPYYTTCPYSNLYSILGVMRGRGNIGTSQLRTLWNLIFMSLLQRFSQFRDHPMHYSTTLGHRMVSLLQRFSQFRDHSMHYSTTLGHRMVSLLQRFPQFRDHLIHYTLHWGTVGVVNSSSEDIGEIPLCAIRLPSYLPL